MVTSYDGPISREPAIPRTQVLSTAPSSGGFFSQLMDYVRNRRNPPNLEDQTPPRLDRENDLPANPRSNDITPEMVRSADVKVKLEVKEASPIPAERPNAIAMAAPITNSAVRGA